MILMYHHVCPASQLPSPVHHLREGWTFSVEPDVLARQLAWVREQGLQIVSLAEYVTHAVDADRGPGRMAAVTFDDGWIDNFEYAFPVLRELKVPATFFVVSGKMSGVPRSRLMKPAMLRELLAHDMTIGAHSRTHPDLSMIPKASMWDEIAGSKADLEDLLGVKVDFLAYPGGRFNADVISVTREAGFRAACSVIPAGRNFAAARYSLSRDVLFSGMRSLRNRFIVGPYGRWIWRRAKRARAWLSPI